MQKKLVQQSKQTLCFAVTVEAGVVKNVSNAYVYTPPTKHDIKKRTDAPKEAS